MFKEKSPGEPAGRPRCSPRENAIPLHGKGTGNFILATRPSFVKNTQTAKN
ncbi:MAG: hypothetical protein ABSA18_07830 [Dehalococcoidia bacterium]|jgi:hypothetical protein